MINKQREDLRHQLYDGKISFSDFFIKANALRITEQLAKEGISKYCPGCGAAHYLDGSWEVIEDHKNCLLHIINNK